MTPAALKTRREFLRSTLLGGALTWTVPSFVGSTMDSLGATLQNSTGPGLTGKDDPILVVLQLAGGNDGLNTLVPFTNDHYHRARPTLGLKAEAVLRLDDHYGLHPALTGFQRLHADGLLTAIHGVGYPNPNRSHFRSMEIWQTATDANRVESRGWIGRYFDNQCPGCEADAAIGLLKETPQAFVGEQPRGVVFQNPQQFKRNRVGQEADEEMQHLLDPHDDENTNEGGSIGALGGQGNAMEAPLDFLERMALDAEASSARVRSLAGKPARSGFPASRLGRDLELVSRFIAGGLSTRIYYLSHGGFDTHQNQTGTHERLLRELGDALHAFCTDLKSQGNLGRVAVLTFSEFGRRVSENGSRGTDHGAAAPVFIVGGGFAPGLLGRDPDLAPASLHQGDLAHTTDFRSVYATLLERHLRVPSAPILGRAFPLLNKG